MVIRGRIHNGVISFGNEISLPEGMEVTVVVPTEREVGATASSAIAEQRGRLLEARRDIESLPNENPGDTFSGADHDRILYGDQ
jgi:hypothetical protein